MWQEGGGREEGDFVFVKRFSRPRAYFLAKTVVCRRILSKFRLLRRKFREGRGAYGQESVFRGVGMSEHACEKGKRKVVITLFFNLFRQNC